ncbi:MAG: hypothetical protein JSW04_11520 [Desulfobacterales bacterium]|nr:MAG: hypothetical protein JSW04_11520 [Desulfobacterales bacterium]
MLPLISIYFGGVLTLLLAILHSRYYIMFNWKDDFEKITSINARIFYTIHIALLLLFFMIAAISISYAKELSQSVGLAFGFNLLYSIFWMWRLIWQFVYFKMEKGQKIPPIGIFLIIIFILLVVSYLIPVVCRFL